MAGDLAIGVDFGGTKLLAAVVDVSNGEILGTAKKKTNPDDDAKALMERIYDGIDEAMDVAGIKKRQGIKGIGVGIAGQIDTDAGILLGAPRGKAARISSVSSWEPESAVRSCKMASSTPARPVPLARLGI